MSRRNAGIYLDDILQAISKIYTYTDGMDYAAFVANSLVIDAVIRNLEIIGEASKNLPDEIKDQYPEVPWLQITGMRNKVIHEYFGVDPEIVWYTLQNRITRLLRPD